MRKQQFQVGECQIRCVPEPEHVVRAGVKIARRVEVPARTEVIMPCKLTHALVGYKGLLPLPNLAPINGDMQKTG